MLLAFFFAAATLPRQMEEIAVAAHGHAGAAAAVIETGRRASFHGAERFPMQSVYKLPIAMAVMEDIGRGRLSLDRKIRVTPADLVPPRLHSPLRDEHPGGNVDVTVRDLLRYAISESDGTASDVLLRAAGGPQRVTGYLRRIGVDGMTVATSEAEMAAGPMVQYRNWSTPAAAVALLEALERSGDSLLLNLMTHSSPGPKRIKGLLPPGAVVAHKTGTSGTTPDGLTRATNDIGIVTLPGGRHLAIAVFVADSKAGEEVREAVIAKIARAAWDWAER